MSKAGLQALTRGLAVEWGMSISLITGRGFFAEDSMLPLA